MSRSIEIPLEKVVFVPEVYPRFETDERRVREFVEAMECGEQFPPLKVARDGNHYVLLDGKHRLEAMKIRQEEKGRVDILPVPGKYWLLAAVMYNHKSSKPLSRGEIKAVIAAAWERGIRSVSEIAEKIGCSVQYVRKIMKPARDEAQRERNRKVVAFHRQGVTQREIAENLGISQSSVSEIIGKETVSIPIMSIRSKSCDSPGSCKDARDNGDPNTIATGPIPGAWGSPAAHDSRHCEAQSLPTKLHDNANSHAEEEPFRSFLPEVFPNNDLRPSEWDALRAIELVKRYHLDVVDIMDHIKESVPWIRETLIAAIALAIQPITPEALFRVASGLEMELGQAEVIQENLIYATSFSPICDQLPQWVEDNLSSKEVALIAELSSTDQHTLPYLFKGEDPPEQQSGSWYENLPEHYKEGLNATVVLLREVRDDLKKRKFKDKSGTQLLKQMNRTRISFNEVYDAMLTCNREGLF